MDDKREDRRIKNRVVLYYKKVQPEEIESVRDDIYYTVEPDDSFSFFMSLKRLDSSFGDLNKAFVLMMKQMDAKLNYIIELFRTNGKLDEFRGFKQTKSCDISSKGISFESTDDFSVGDYMYLKIFLPIASHHPIKVLSKIVRKDKEKGNFCYGVEFEDIVGENSELIIHYMIFVERKIAKSRLKDNV